MSYGFESYGLDAYGSNAAASVGPLTFLGAVAISTNIVQVTLSKPPQALSSQLAGDALNPATWSVIRNDTGVGFTVVEITPTTSDQVWNVRVLEPLASSNVAHTIAASGLLAADGGLSGSPTSAEFQGMLSTKTATPDALAADRDFSIVDLANPQASLSSGATGGVYTIGQDGDYDLDGGTDFVRKLILRRLMTVRGGYRFLPNFGLGIQVKQPLPAADVISFQKEIETQVKLEPEVDKVRVLVTQDRNALTVLVQANLRATGQNITVPLEVPFTVEL